MQLLEMEVAHPGAPLGGGHRLAGGRGGVWRGPGNAWGTRVGHPESLQHGPPVTVEERAPAPLAGAGPSRRGLFSEAPGCGWSPPPPPGARPCCWRLPAGRPQPRCCLNKTKFFFRARPPVVKGPIYGPRPARAPPALRWRWPRPVIYSFSFARSRGRRMTGAIYPGPPWLAAEDGLSPALTGAIHSPAAALPPRPRSLLRLLETLRNPVGENKPGCLCPGPPPLPRLSVRR